MAILLLHGEEHPMFNKPGIRLGKTHSKETKEKMSKSRKNKINGEDNLFYGKHHTEETKKLLSEKAKERHRLRKENK